MNDNDKQRTWKQVAQEVLSGDFLTREWFRQQYALFILIGALVFLYIFFGFQAQRQQHKLTGLQKEMQAKHFEQLTIEAELTERTRQSTMTRELKANGSELKVNQRPVVYIP